MNFSQDVNSMLLGIWWDEEPQTKKEEKPTKTSSDKEEKLIKTSSQKEEKPPKPGIRKEEKPAKPATQKEERPTKPVQKVIKQTKAATTYKTAATTYRTAAVTYKTVPKKLLKEQKERRGKENVRPSNGTKEIFDEMPKKSKAETEDLNYMNREKGELWMTHERRGERETDRDRHREREDQILIRKRHLTRSHQFLPVLLFGWVHWVRVPLPCYPSPSTTWEL
ncbi:triadin-like [Gracilinanus agilis]|uniref:triadin-like n=1 Tax=Gracilinanus agilis TaxID=191870 RepID=UPI001CFECFF3|nr:triadin-like [Gracilinanus agilis]